MARFLFLEKEAKGSEELESCWGHWLGRLSVCIGSCWFHIIQDIKIILISLVLCRLNGFKFDNLKYTNEFQVFTKNLERGKHVLCLDISEYISFTMYDQIRAKRNKCSLLNPQKPLNNHQRINKNIAAIIVSHTLCQKVG